MTTSWRATIDTILLWRTLFNTITSAAKSYKQPNNQTAIRIRTIKKPTFSKNSKPESSETEEWNKQWIIIPPDIASKLQRTPINKAGLLQKDKLFREAANKLLKHWADNIKDVTRQFSVTIRGEDPRDIGRFFVDKEKVLNSLIEELNDIHVAKIDGVMYGTPQHKDFLHALTHLKKQLAEAKTLNKYMRIIDDPLSKIDSIQGALIHVKPLLTSLSNIRASCKYLTEELETDLLYRIVSKLIEVVREEYDVRMLFSDTWDEAPGKIKSVFMHVLNSKAVEDSEEEVRPTTSYEVPREVQRRPGTSYRKNPFVAEVKAKVKNRARYIVKIIGDLLDLGEKIAQLRSMLSDTNVGTRAKEMLILYEIKRVDFNIWDESNSLSWALFVDGFRQKFRGVLNTKNESESSESGEEESGSVIWNVV